MNSEPADALSTNIRRIRTAQQLSQLHVAEQAGLSREGYRKIEDGESQPRPETLSSIARTLRVPVAKLLVPVRPLARVRFRARKNLHSREEVLATVAQQLDHSHELEELIGEQKHPVLDRLRKGIKATRGEARAREAARRAREALGLKEEESIRDVCGLFEDNGIRVLTPVVASDGFFGLSVAEADRGPAVVVNTWERISVECWLFTAAHELGHLLLHPHAYDVRKTEADDAEEKEADVFASHFLMPEKVFRKELNEACGLCWYDRVFKLKRMFRVSYRSVLSRATADLKAGQRRQVWSQFNVDYERRNGRPLPGAVEPNGLPPEAFLRRPAERSAEEPEHLARHDFMPDRLARLVRQALEQDAITVSKGAEMLCISQLEMRYLVKSWANDARGRRRSRS